MLTWMQKILHERISPNLRLTFNDNNYIINSVNRPGSIKIKRMSQFYTFGETDMKLSKISPVNENINFVKFEMYAPGWDMRQPLFHVKADGFVINYDILGLIYWMFNRLEEVGSDNLDENGRFLAINSHAYKFKYLERPLVDEWIDLLKRISTKLWQNLVVIDSDFKVDISHDVDLPGFYSLLSWSEMPRFVAREIIKRHNFKTVIKALTVKISRNHNFSNNSTVDIFSWIMDQSDLHNITSTFYFITGNSEHYAHHIFDTKYSIDHPAIRSLMIEVNKRGHKIGLHPSYNSYNNKSRLQKELNKLRNACNQENIEIKNISSRMHYLRWNQPNTLLALNGIGIYYDNTMGYADHAGFRCGTCHEYPAFDPIKKENLNIRIRPLIAMEHTLIHKDYMGLGVSMLTLNKLIELKNSCKNVKGTFSLLWHNNQLSTDNERKIYSSFLNTIEGNN
jgi:hypothetical protein